MRQWLWIGAALAACGKAPAPAPGSAGSAGPLAGPPDWVKRLGDTNAQRVDAVAVDAAGHVFGAGQTCGKRVGTDYGQGSIDLGSGPRDVTGCALFVASYEGDGRPRWSYVEGDPDRQAAAYALAITPSGSVLVAGQRGLAMVVDELSPTGALVASHRYGPPDDANGRATPRSLALAPDGDRIVGGSIATRADLGTGVIEHAGTASFVARYAPDGKPLWIRFPSVPSQYQAEARAVAIGPAGEVYACGQTDGPSGGASGGSFVQALDGATGEVAWTKLTPGKCNALVAVAGGVVAGGADVVEEGTVVAKLDSNGTVQWRMKASPNGFVPTALAASGAGVAVIGEEVDHRTGLLLLDDKGAAGTTQTYEGWFEPSSLATLSGGVVIGGTVERRTTLGRAAPVTPEPVAGDEPNLDGVVARVSFP